MRRLLEDAVKALTPERRKRLYRVGWIVLTVLSLKGVVLPGDVDLYLLAFSALLGLADANTPISLRTKMAVGEEHAWLRDLRETGEGTYYPRPLTSPQGVVGVPGTVPPVPVDHPVDADHPPADVED